MRIGLFALLLFCSGTGCAESGARTEGSAVNVTFRIETAAGNRSDTFNRGDIARFVFLVHNHSDASVQLGYTFPPHRVTVLTENSAEPAWQAHQGRMFPQVMKHETIAPGERIEFAVEWDFQDDRKSGEFVLPGRYDVRPEFHAFLEDRKLPSRLSAQQITLEE